MPYQANVLSIMIASPSDVDDLREAARDVIHDWNCVHSQSQSLVILPVGWETHSIPELGGRPQGIINKQVLEQCDLLIAIFHSRIGSATGEHASGTVEEIKRHHSLGKPVMVYFSSAGIPMDRIDDKQVSQLKEFKKWCQSSGLISEFNAKDEFKTQLGRHLQKRILEWGHLNSGKEIEIPPALSDEARILLNHARESSNGIILKIQGIEDFIETNDHYFGNGGPRDYANWSAQLAALTQNKLLELAEKLPNGAAYRVTKKGYDHSL